MNKMKDMPGMGDIQSMLGKMGMGGMGKNVRVDTNAMKMQMDKYNKMEQMKERIRRKAEKNQQQKTVVQPEVAPTRKYTEQELKEFLDSVEKGEKTPRDAKPKTGKKKKGKK
jgi:6-phosphogluconate dehydrogenase